MPLESQQPWPQVTSSGSWRVSRPAWRMHSAFHNLHAPGRAGGQNGEPVGNERPTHRLGGMADLPTADRFWKGYSRAPCRGAGACQPGVPRPGRGWVRWTRGRRVRRRVCPWRCSSAESARTSARGKAGCPSRRPPRAVGDAASARRRAADGSPVSRRRPSRRAARGHGELKQRRRNHDDSAKTRAADRAIRTGWKLGTGAASQPTSGLIRRRPARPCASGVRPPRPAQARRGSGPPSCPARART